MSSEHLSDSLHMVMVGNCLKLMNLPGHDIAGYRIWWKDLHCPHEIVLTSEATAPDNLLTTGRMRRYGYEKGSAGFFYMSNLTAITTLY